MKKAGTDPPTQKIEIPVADPIKLFFLANKEFLRFSLLS